MAWKSYNFVNLTDQLWYIQLIELTTPKGQLIELIVFATDLLDSLEQSLRKVEGGVLVEPQVSKLGTLHGLRQGFQPLCPHPQIVSATIGLIRILDALSSHL
jgi:hypothetical protein